MMFTYNVLKYEGVVDTTTGCDVITVIDNAACAVSKELMNTFESLLYEKFEER